MSQVIIGRRLIVDVDEEPIEDGVLVIDGGRVQAAGRRGEVAEPAGATVIDVGSDTLMPALIDSHGHITTNMHRRGDLASQSALDPVEAALQGVANLRADLASGVTTMRTLGAPGTIEPRFRDAIARGEVDGPRLVIAIRLLRPTHGTASFIATTADGPDELRRRIRETFAMGADWVKLMVTNVTRGEGIDAYLRGDMTTVPSFSRDEVRFAIDEAHALGLKVAAHAIGGPAMRWTIEAGVDSIEHADLLEAQDVEVFARHGAYLSDPNLQLFLDDEERVLSRAYGRPREPWWRARTGAAAESLRTYVPQLVAAGVRICLAVDSNHGDLWREVGHLADITGSSRVALRAVTKNPAEMLGMADEVGSLRPGFRADVISVGGDPLADPWALERVRLVMQDGVEVGERARQAPLPWA
jgi:imidazolonepropionase-like amidohydrolase